MTTANQITPGMTLNIDGKIFRVESSVKVTVAKGTPFVKTKLRNLVTEEMIEKNFKLDQMVQEVSLFERTLEFLYPEGKEYLFLDIGNLEQVLVPASILADKVHYLERRDPSQGDVLWRYDLRHRTASISRNHGRQDGRRLLLLATTKKGVLETGAKSMFRSLSKAAM